MAELVPSVDLKKADGSPLKVNFFFENGLPVKPLIEEKYSIWRNNKTEKYGVTVKVDTSLIINDYSLMGVSFHDNNDETKNIWIHLSECYFLVKNVDSEIVKSMIENGIGIAFVDNNGKQL